MFAADGRTTLALPRPRETWLLERDGSLVSARREDSRAVSQRDTPIIARPVDAGGTITFNGRRWRGELAISVTDAGLLVVNRVRMDDYLRGVVPLEIGTRALADAAAAEAQAVAARSYAYMHLMGPSRLYDMLATVADQVYGGMNAETSLGNQAVDATAGLLLLYDGRVVNAPYHATCGGSTAEPGEAWRAGPEPYLKSVSDEIPGTDRYYCDWAPKYRWTRIYSSDELRESIARYVRTLPGGGGGVKRVRSVAVADVTPGGRVATLAVETDRGSWALRGDAIRSALRTTSGEMLYSTYFSLYAVPGDGEVQALTLHGGGNGHGVGMCQAGAIGRARAGQDFRTILRTYYPGTTVGPVE
jgi:stage II sporulation protein D